MSDNRCFAYNKQGQRCDLDGGHTSDHSIILSWTDEECYTPGALLRPPPSVEKAIVAEVENLGPVPTYGVDKPGTCVLCDHPMHGGECARCDCRHGISS